MQMGASYLIAGTYYIKKWVNNNFYEYTFVELRSLSGPVGGY